MRFLAPIMIVVLIMSVHSVSRQSIIKDTNEIHTRFMADSVWSTRWLNHLLRVELVVCGFGNEGLLQLPSCLRKIYYIIIHSENPFHVFSVPVWVSLQNCGHNEVLDEVEIFTHPLIKKWDPSTTLEILCLLLNENLKTNNLDVILNSVNIFILAQDNRTLLLLVGMKQVTPFHWIGSWRAKTVRGYNWVLVAVEAHLPF